MNALGGQGLNFVVRKYRELQMHHVLVVIPRDGGRCDKFWAIMRNRLAVLCMVGWLVSLLLPNAQ
jgi:hypothetical protein